MSIKVSIPVTSFTKHKKIASELNEMIEKINLANGLIEGVFYNKNSFNSGEYELVVSYKEEVILPKVSIRHVERPSKFKANSSSKYYCVYKEGNKWRYKFVRKNKVYQSKRFDTELEAALMYDNHVYSVDGNTRKLNFPEKVFK